MTLIDRVVTLSTTFLPLDQMRSALLPPLRLARAGTVVAARTVRHWELVLEGAPASAGGARERPAVATETAGPAPVTAQSSHDLPVDDGTELSDADAQARLAPATARIW